MYWYSVWQWYFCLVRTAPLWEDSGGGGPLRPIQLEVAVPCCTVLGWALPFRAVLCWVVACCVVLCSVGPCCAVLCCVSGQGLPSG